MSPAYCMVRTKPIQSLFFCACMQNAHVCMVCVNVLVYNTETNTTANDSANENDDNKHGNDYDEE